MSEKTLIKTIENIALEGIELETCDFATYFVGRRSKRFRYEWVNSTFRPPIPKGRSNVDPGDLQRILRREFGDSAIGSTFPKTSQS